MIPARCPNLSGVLCVAALVAAGAACKKDELQGAKAEVEETSIKLDLPPVPEFTAPAANPDGTHTVQELRLKGTKFLDTDVRVKGHVIWIYDCATAIRTPEMSEEQLKKVMADEPERCSRPNFYLGDAADTAADKGIWVVEVPRAPRADEKKALPDEVVKEMQTAFAAVPAFKVGDPVTVTGKFALTSPKGFRNSDGLVVFASMTNDAAPAAPAPK
jgi:S-formylglutathione hydrolase FrmB